MRKISYKAVKKTGIRKKIHLHTPRHGFAPTCLSKFINLKYFQTLLGHTSSKTTEIYTHVGSTKLAAGKSPLDGLVESGIFER
ncbi:MAG: tyrosine-type recombinase/integrase [Cyclobacteriaceae bacterium]